MNILAIGAHFDDVELGCGGSLIRHARSGDSVTVAVLTRSGYSAPGGRRVRMDAEAIKEGRRAAKILGAEMICLNFRTFEVPCDEKLTVKILNLIEKKRIDTVYSHWTGDIHRDHANAGRCALMAGRRVPRFLMYRSNLYGSGSDFRGKLYSDISPFFDQKFDAIRCYRTELGRVGGTWLEMVRCQNSLSGMEVGVKYAECFEAVRYLL